MSRILAPLSKYATYHRDKRNIFTHFFGVPMIVFAVMVLTARPVFQVADYAITPLHILLVLSCLYYLRLELRMGVVMSASFVAMAYGALMTSSMSTLSWAVFGISTFIVGWVIQFVGHFYEGKKPAFLDDIAGLIVGPLFVTVELLFLLGLRRDLEEQIERVAGPTLIRQRPAVA
jgi:uncharacterized membrane protein YGL010W